MLKYYHGKFCSNLPQKSIFSSLNINNIVHVIMKYMVMSFGTTLSKFLALFTMARHVVVYYQHMTKGGMGHSNSFDVL